jgi:hypothetical protein
VQRFYPRLRADELLTADRGFYSWQAGDAAVATGAALLWRAPTPARPARRGRVTRRDLPHGTDRPHHPWTPPRASAGRRPRRCRPARHQPSPTRSTTADYLSSTWPESSNTTCLTGSATAPRADRRAVHHPRPGGNHGARADELAAAYHQRWEEEAANNQLKTHLRGPGPGGCCARDCPSWCTRRSGPT